MRIRSFGIGQMSKFRPMRHLCQVIEKCSEKGAN